MKKVLIIDGQGGRIGRAFVEQLAPYADRLDLYAVGTNGIATSNMLKGGNVKAATGENSILVLAKKADIITGPLGIIIADAMLGEITPAAACAVSSADAARVLVPMNKTQCDNIVVGVKDVPLSALIEQAKDEILRLAEV
ncbi:MAG: DUF3842 family protein [Clostridia bacterium]|nr:DUF3842 family protein [Clostridia bacterium]